MIKGGGWYDVHEKVFRASNRYGIPFNEQDSDIGFRVVFSVKMSQSQDNNAAENQASSNQQSFPQPGFIDNEYVPVKGGTFIMGSNNDNENERPAHKVSINDFFITRYEITNQEFALFLNVMGNQIQGGTTWLRNKAGPDYDDVLPLILYKDGQWTVLSGYEKHPAVSVSYYGARAYCDWAGGRLPTEAEWEYASGCGGKYRYPWGNNWEPNKANTSKLNNNSLRALMSEFNIYNGIREGTLPVGSFEPNGFGLYDMAGNAWEWVADWYSEIYFRQSPQYNPICTDSSSDRVVIKGGGWYEEDEKVFRASNRMGISPTERDADVGFRVVRK